MTNESDFQNALDANPEDHQTRLVFADWLQERDDPRADGYRALGVLRRVPSDPHFGFLWNSDYGNRVCPSPYVLPRDWYEPLDANDGPGKLKPPGGLRLLNQGESRRAKEDKAALAFALLPPERRAELLAGGG